MQESFGRWEAGMALDAISIDEFAEIDEQAAASNLHRQVMGDGGVAIHYPKGLIYRSPGGVCIRVTHQPL